MTTSTDSPRPGLSAVADAVPLELRDLAPDPREEWQRLLHFVRWSAEDERAAVASVEPLFRAGPDLVVCQGSPPRA